MFQRLLIANRGEVALRVARAAADLGLPAVAVYAEDDAQAPHRAAAAQAVALPGAGPAAYLNGARLLRIARETGCDALHPGWGFLSERADFVAECEAAGVTFVGPTAEQVALLGDKSQARTLAQRCRVPVLPGTDGAVDVAGAQAFFATQGGAPVLVKAVGGGGGRALRVVRTADELPAAHARCAAEAQAAFGSPGVFVERWLPRARHVEVQIVGDGVHAVSLGDRDCSLQRRYQKLVEIAPAPQLDAPRRQALAQAALALARALRWRSLGTVEFLVDLDGPGWWFIEGNPRLQVEHTVTEQVTGIDLVRLQIGIAAGATLADLGLAQPPAARGCAVQWRINAETFDAQRRARPAAGRLARCELAAGPGIRVDTHARAGTALTPLYDTLLAKLVVQGDDLGHALRRSRRALAECAVEGGMDGEPPRGVTNLPLLRALAALPALAAGPVDTGFVESQLGALLPHDVLDAGGATPSDAGVPDGAVAVRAPLAGRLLQWAVAPGDAVAGGTVLAVLDAMKMEHEVSAGGAARVLALHAGAGELVAEGRLLATLAPAEEIEAAAAVGDAQLVAADPGAIRADLKAVFDRHAFTLDAARPEAVARRHALGLRTARENVADLCDAGSFSEYGALAVAAQSARRSADDLRRNTPADGIVTGVGSVNGAPFGAERSRTVVMAYDATVLAGTQGLRNHQKTDRLLGLALANRLPVVLFAEGGGGRPGDTDMPIVAGLHVGSFASFARLSGQVPLVGVVAGRCFAGNAALLGCCDTVIATRGANIGMGGPAMIEGGGLGVFRPEEVGPAAVQSRNGVVDLLVDDEAAAVVAARRYLSYFQGSLTGWDAAPQTELRGAVPENRLRVYDVRRVLHGLFDSGSVLELRAGFGGAVVTALARVEGRPVGVLANDPAQGGGAIGPTAADKAACFMQLCNAHGLPLVTLVDTPGFLVGPEVEAQAQVRHAARLFVTAAALRVPCFAVVLRKGYGLGAMAMAAGGFHAPDFTVAWPTGEFGAMGLEGAVKLGWRKELAAAAEGAEREALYRELVARQYEAGGALNMAATLEIDAVIDPAETRGWLARGLASVSALRAPAARPVDPW